MELVLTPEALGFATLIFLLRVFNYSISTVRLVFIGRGMKIGAAFGSYVGMWLEACFIVSYSTVTIITHADGHAIAQALRASNYGATLSKGEGRDGEVDIIRSTTVNRDIPALVSIVQSINTNAFIDVEAAKTPLRGWIPGGPPRRR